MNALADRCQLEFLEEFSPRTWWGQAKCAGLSTDLFFEREHEAEALAVCAGCPVWKQCLLTNINEEVGIYGGKTPEERSSIRQAFALRGGHQPSGDEGDDQG